MENIISALLVHNRKDDPGEMSFALERLSVKTVRARNCKEAENRLSNAPAPHFVLTDTVLPDGTWANVLDLATKAPEPVNVIVVSPTADMDLYLDVMERGAFDFVTDLFTVAEFEHVVRCAVDNAIGRREARRVGPLCEPSNKAYGNQPGWSRPSEARSAGKIRLPLESDSSHD